MIVAGCTSTTAPRIASLSGVSGSGQAAVVGTILGQPFVVKVQDQNQVPVQGLKVTWLVTAGGGILLPEESFTDAEGLAFTFLRVGPVAGINRVTATLGAGPIVVFTATGTAPPPPPP